MNIFLSPLTVYAKDVKGRIVEYTVREVKGEVCEVPGHRVLIHEHEGMAFFDDGDIASVTFIMRIDFNYEKRIGTHEGYRVYTFEDSSTQVTKIKGTQKISKNRKIFTRQATYTYIHGTGRFKGIKGKGSYSGKSFMFDRKTGYADFSGTYTIDSIHKR